MKKLTLKLDGIKDMLSREQMKKIGGGSYAFGSCSEKCGSDPNIVKCASDSGDCKRNGNITITCDGVSHDCPVA